MKIRYYKKSHRMVDTMDNGIDTISVVGGDNFMDALTITNETHIPMSSEFASCLALLYYERRNMVETPSTIK